MIELDGKVVGPFFKERFKQLLNRLAAQVFKATNSQRSSIAFDPSVPPPPPPPSQFIQSKGQCDELKSITR